MTARDTRRPVILHLMHGGGGGLEHSVRLLAEQCSGAFEHRLLHVRRPGPWLLETPGAGRVPVSNVWWDGLGRAVRRTGAQLVHVHHLSGDHRRLVRALARLRLPYGITVHDFHLLCPRVHLVPPHEAYCGAPSDPAVCRACLAHVPVMRVDPVRWRERHYALIKAAQFVAVPSRYTAEILCRHWPELRPIEIPHAYRPAGSDDDAPVRPDAQGIYPVAVVGALSREKGGEMLENLASRAEARDLPLRFVMLGDTHRLGGPRSLYGSRLFVHGSYRREDLPGLLRRNGAVLAVFPAIGPETYSFTLSEVWACGVPAMVPAFGALSERVAESGAGWRIERWSTPDVWLDAIMARVSDADELVRAGTAARLALPPASAGSGYEPHYREALRMRP